MSHGASSAQGGLIACAAFEFWGGLFPVLKTSRAMENHHVSKGDISSNGCVFHSHVYVLGGLEGVYFLCLSMLANLWLSLIPLAPNWVFETRGLLM